MTNANSNETKAVQYDDYDILNAAHKMGGTFHFEYPHNWKEPVPAVTIDIPRGTDGYIRLFGMTDGTTRTQHYLLGCNSKSLYLDRHGSLLLPKFVILLYMTQNKLIHDWKSVRTQQIVTCSSQNL